MGKQINAVTWSSDEKLMLLALYNLHNTDPKKWCVISKTLKRSRSSIRNCFMRINPERSDAPRARCARGSNKCQRCGEFRRGHVCEPELSAYVPSMLLNETNSSNFNRVRIKLSGSANESNALTRSARVDHSCELRCSVPQEHRPLSPTMSLKSVECDELEQLCDDWYRTDQ